LIFRGELAGEAGQRHFHSTLGLEPRGAVWSPAGRELLGHLHLGHDGPGSLGLRIASGQQPLDALSVESGDSEKRHNSDFFLAPFDC
jgi:hypothetical protein